MANYSAASGAHETLTANTVDNVTLTANPAAGVTVVNRTGTAEIFVTLAAGSSAPSAPTVGGANTYIVPAAICSITIPVSAGSVVVALISSGAMSYSVEGLA